MNEESLSIEESYINLAIIETKEQQEKEKRLKQHDQQNKQDKHPQHHNEKILSTFEEIYGTKTPIDVKDIFEKCEDTTRKVLILGRAGIGKSTFCQYVTYRWAKGEIWSEYDLIVLIRLRKLSERRYPSGENYSPVDIIRKEYLPFGDLSSEEK
jgi:predicted NACHT family NTPase